MRAVPSGGLTPAAGKIAGRWRRFETANWAGRIQLATDLVRRLAFKLLALTPRLGLNLAALGRPVRIGTLNAKGKPSVMISYIEPYLRRLRLEGARNPLLIVINPGASPNEQLTKMYKRAVWLLDDEHPWLRTVFTGLFRLLSAARSPEAAFLYSGAHCEFAHAWREGRPVLSFWPDEEEAGRSLLTTLGIPAGSSYICLGLREDAYYQQFLTAKAQERHANLEAREGYFIRNPPLKNYLPMAKQCAEDGLYVLRMGSAVGEPVPPGLHPHIIDYASKCRTPFGDVYLLGTCKFIVAGGAGLWWFGTAFNRPVIHADHYFLPLRLVRPGDLFIPIKLWLISERRFLTFREMLAVDNDLTNAVNCHRLGIELVHNTPEEIAAVVEEMNQRLDGTWQSNEEDEDLQRRFDALYSPEHIGYGLPARIGAQFLRQHSGLLCGAEAWATRPS